MIDYDKLVQSSKWRNFRDKHNKFPGADCAGCPYLFTRNNEREWLCGKIIIAIENPVSLDDDYYSMRKTFANANQTAGALGLKTIGSVNVLLEHLNAMMQCKCQTV